MTPSKNELGFKLRRENAVFQKPILNSLPCIRWLVGSCTTVYINMRRTADRLGEPEIPTGGSGSHSLHHAAVPFRGLVLCTYNIFRDSMQRGVKGDRSNRNIIGERKETEGGVSEPLLCIFNISATVKSPRPVRAEKRV